MDQVALKTDKNTTLNDNITKSFLNTYKSYTKLNSQKEAGTIYTFCFESSVLNYWKVIVIFMFRQVWSLLSTSNCTEEYWT